MVSKNLELDAEREAVKRLHKAATKKISRLNTQGGVNLSGSKLDPRRDLGNLKKYNKRQLNAYRQELSQFNDRGTQYVALADKTILPKQDWEKYKRLENAYNRRVNKRYESVKDTKLPSGNTIDRRMKTVTPDRRSARGVSVNAPYDPPKRAPQGIANRKALEKLIADMRKRVQTDHETKQLRTAQNVFHKMANIIQDKSLAKHVRSLTPEQFRILWNYTSFASAISQDYEIMKKMLTGEDKAYESDVYQQQLEEANELAAWAKKLKIK